MILALGMWVHVIINAMVTFSPTRNPIWGELRVAGVVLATASLWVALAVAV